MLKNIICLLIAISIVFPAQAALQGDKTQIIVSGTGIVKAKADMAYVVVGVERTERTAAKAQEITAQKMNNILTSLRKMRIPKDKIETTEFDLRPKYDYKAGKREFIGYTASNKIRVTLDDLDRLGKIIDTSIAAGADNVSNVSFNVKDAASYKKEALEKAFKAAKEKAEIIAAASNLVLTKIIRIQESEADVIPRGIQAFKAEAGAAETPIVPGKVEVRGNLTVVYECDKK